MVGELALFLREFVNPKKNPRHLCCGCLRVFFWESINIKQIAPFKVRYTQGFLIYAIMNCADLRIYAK